MKTFLAALVLDLLAAALCVGGQLPQNTFPAAQNTFAAGCECGPDCPCAPGDDCGCLEEVCHGGSSARAERKAARRGGEPQNGYAPEPAPAPQRVVPVAVPVSRNPQTTFTPAATAATADGWNYDAATGTTWRYVSTAGPSAPAYQPMMAAPMYGAGDCASCAPQAMPYGAYGGFQGGYGQGYGGGEQAQPQRRAGLFRGRAARGGGGGCGG